MNESDDGESEGENDGVNKIVEDSGKTGRDDGKDVTRNEEITVLED